MGPDTITRSSVRDDAWDEIWDAYDAGHPPAPSPALPPARRPIRRTHGLPLLLAGLILSLLAGTAVTAMPMQAARELVAVLRAADHSALAPMVDWPALLAGLPSADPQEEDFLAALSHHVHRHAATPEGLVALMQARLGPVWPTPELAAVGFGTARLVLPAPGQPGRGIALSLALREMLPPRWKLVGVEPLG
ncbi:hypothetical protein SAMN04487779_1001259 [Belnapia rosea]|uniref:DUF2939 domain-containing protein n=1 Tax=Belnapia rosea TaxID=938405 RepID=A0A1G6JRY0_9PROT|nr:hypothetical protein SAMN04487779_1001259 [Belnapia rosea]